MACRRPLPGLGDWGRCPGACSAQGPRAWKCRGRDSKGRDPWEQDGSRAPSVPQAPGMGPPGPGSFRGGTEKPHRSSRRRWPHGRRGRGAVSRLFQHVEETAAQNPTCHAACRRGSRRADRRPRGNVPRDPGGARAGRAPRACKPDGRSSMALTYVRVGERALFVGDPARDGHPRGLTEHTRRFHESEEG